MESIAVVVPFFQRKRGLLGKAIRSALAQRVPNPVHIYVIDDGSPVPAREELQELGDIDRSRVHLIERPNGGAGAARNTALNALSDDVSHVAFLDSDDEWHPHHLGSAMRALSRGYDAYFADFVAVGYPDQSNFDRIGTLWDVPHPVIDKEARLYALGETPLEHIVRDGGGLIQTSTVVYDFRKFRALRFREEFFNGQDFFFWIDLGERGARFCFSTCIECTNGEGINIFQGAGWGTDRSMQRLRNEIFVWTSVSRIYAMPPRLRAANLRTIRALETNVVRDLLFRLRRRRPLHLAQLRDILRLDPTFALSAPTTALRIMAEQLLPRGAASRRS